MSNVQMSYICTPNALLYYLVSDICTYPTISSRINTCVLTPHKEISSNDQDGKQLRNVVKLHNVVTD